MQVKNDGYTPDVLVPVWEKYLLTIPEAAAYFGIGQNRIAQMLKMPGCNFCVVVGNGKRLVNRRLFEEYLDNVKRI